MRLSLLLVLSVGVGSAAADDLAPAKRAKQLLDKQLAVMTSGGSKDFIATLAPDAVVLIPDAYVAAKALGDNEVFLDVDEASLRPAKSLKLVAGGTADVIWLGTEITQPYQISVDCPPALAKCKSKRTLRATELFVRNGDAWTAVALHLDDPPPKIAITPEVSAVVAPTAPGPLTALLTNPTALAAAIKDDPGVIVLGTETAERAVGAAAAKKLLGAWNKLTFELDGKSAEVRTKTWGYAAANVRWVRTGKPPIAMRATVFAVPGATEGTWKVVAAHYSVAHHRMLY